MSNGDSGGARGGRGRGWSQPENQPRELRRPRITPEDERAEVKSNLSAEAKEWYPPNYNQANSAPTYVHDQAPYQRIPRFSVQDRLRQAQHQQNPYNFEDMSYSLEESENAELQEHIAYLITVMCEITFDPAKFDSLCGPLVDLFAASLSHEPSTRALVEAIVNQAVAEPNFRYNGARLCSMYESVGGDEESTFRACLLERCSVEENKIVSGVGSSEEHMRGFAMFLAEIYTQLEEHTQGGRIKSLGESLCKVLLHLLDTDSEQNIKSVCQILKLSGIALDADCSAGMHAAFERLKLRAHIPLVRHVLQLRATRWGVPDPAPNPNPQPQPQPQPNHTTNTRNNRAVNGSTGGENDRAEGYLADGAALTAEERAFLTSHLQPKAPLDDDILEELENEAWDTGMDADMQAGFLEFLKLSNQIKR